MIDIYLIRHGSTAGNLEGRYVGMTDEPLTQDAFHELENNRDQYPGADIVFASPLKRCVQTAGILFPDKEAKLLPGLRECDFGDFEYKNYRELADDSDYQKWLDGKGTGAFPKGESRQEFSDRCCKAFEEACSEALKYKVNSAAFVVHGGTLMAVLDRYSQPHRDYYEWQIRPAEGFWCRLDVMPQTYDAGYGKTQKFVLTDMRPIPLPPAMTGIQDRVIMKGGKKLRCGYTTGSCAAAAAKAAAFMLLSGFFCHRIDIDTPEGLSLHLPVERVQITHEYASCAVRKYSGDDPDVTDGILIYARAEKINEDNLIEKCVSECREDISALHIIIDGGTGVGRVTKPGLDQDIGSAAINSIPRKMIETEVSRVCEDFEYFKDMKITISVPDGVEIAEKTFNPHLGIEGGISILGTSGIVEPMSEKALIESIRVELKQKAAQKKEYVIATQGNYGENFIHSIKNNSAYEGALRLLPDFEDSVKCSNYVGETLDIAEETGFKGILFVAHIGKFIKVSGGIMNTHSSNADCRAELFAASAMRSDVPANIVKKILETNTTEEAVCILKESGYLKQTMDEVTARIKYYLQRRCKGAIMTEAVIFSNQYGFLGESDGAEAMLKKIAAAASDIMHPDRL